MKTKHLACCGFDCGNCPFFIYTETRDAELGKKLIEKFSTPQKTFTTDDLICFGCHADTASAHKFCAECAIRLCSIGRGLQSCGQCKDFPCPTLTRSIHSDTPSYELLLKIHARKCKNHELSVHTFQKTLGRHREICILTKLPQNCFKGIETLRTV